MTDVNMQQLVNEYITKMKFMKRYNDTQFSCRQIEPIKQQAHLKNILHVPTSAAVMKTARQTANLRLYIQYAVNFRIP